MNLNWSIDLMGSDQKQEMILLASQSDHYPLFLTAQ
ncbi:MAG: hypothetical protein RIT27_2391 [Pseudomonadota bacterium]|jgi:hypothetical protein